MLNPNKMLGKAGHARWCDCDCWYVAGDACGDKKFKKVTRKREKNAWRRAHGLL